MEKWENEKDGLNEIWGRRGRVDKGIQGRVTNIESLLEKPYGNILL